MAQARKWHVRVTVGPILVHESPREQAGASLLKSIFNKKFVQQAHRCGKLVLDGTEG